MAHATSTRDCRHRPTQIGHAVKAVGPTHWTLRRRGSMPRRRRRQAGVGFWLMAAAENWGHE